MVACIGWLCCRLWLDPVDLGIWLHGPGWIWISMAIVMSCWENERNKQISPCFCQTQIGRVGTGKQCNFPLLTITRVPRSQTGWKSPGVFLVKGNELPCWKTFMWTLWESLEPQCIPQTMYCLLWRNRSLYASFISLEPAVTHMSRN